MLYEVSKDTPLMDSSIGKQLEAGVGSMRGASYGLENGAVNVARDDGAKAVEDLNGVVIALLEAAKSMSSCSSGMPQPGMMQQLKELSGDQQKLNEALKQLMKDGGKSMDHRLQGQLDRMAQEQQRIKEQLQQLMEQMTEGGTLGRLDDVTEKMDEIAERLRDGRLDDETLREQDWALTRLLDSQRSMRERDFGRERQSQTGEELGAIPPPSPLADGLDGEQRDLREDLLKALDRRYPPKYEDLIRRYFRSLTEDGPSLP
jgi:DNA-binding ferritin-like protein